LLHRLIVQDEHSFVILIAKSDFRQAKVHYDILPALVKTVRNYIISRKTGRTLRIKLYDGNRY